MNRFLFVPLRGARRNSYIVTCTTSNECLVVDPPKDAALVAAVLNEKSLTLRSIVLTSGHGAYSAGVEALRVIQPDARLAAHPASGVLEHGGRELQHGDTIVLGRLRVSVLATPGEKSGGISLYLPFGPGEAGSVLTGDALRDGGMGRTEDPEERRRLMEAVRDSLFCLGDGVRVYPGQGPPSTIGVERHHNPCIEPVCARGSSDR